MENSKRGNKNGFPVASMQKKVVKNPGESWYNRLEIHGGQLGDNNFFSGKAQYLKSKLFKNYQVIPNLGIFAPNLFWPESNRFQRIRRFCRKKKKKLPQKILFH